jgi:hypothetical protein
MQANADAPTLTEGQLLILQTLDNEIEACVHLHAHTATVLASCNFFRTAAELLGRNADSPAEAVVYLSGLGLVVPQATVWADLAAQSSAKDAARHSVSEAEAARLASLARVILTAMRCAFGIYERASGDTIHSRKTKAESAEQTIDFIPNILTDGKERTKNARDGEGIGDHPRRGFPRNNVPFPLSRGAAVCNVPKDRSGESGRLGRD